MQDNCQSGSWARPQTFLNVETTAGTVDWWCTYRGDPYPLGYDYATWAITCARRFCEGSSDYGFGLVVEASGVDKVRPYGSAPNSVVLVACSR